MRRVVVTGLGIVSSIGNNAAEVTASLRDAKSGISFSSDFAEHGFKWLTAQMTHFIDTVRLARQAT